jgi:hypothetical protein
LTCEKSGAINKPPLRYKTKKRRKARKGGRRQLLARNQGGGKRAAAAEAEHANGQPNSRGGNPESGEGSQDPAIPERLNRLQPTKPNAQDEEQLKYALFFPGFPRKSRERLTQKITSHAEEETIRNATQEHAMADPDQRHEGVVNEPHQFTSHSTRTPAAETGTVASSGPPPHSRPSSGPPHSAAAHGASDITRTQRHRLKPPVLAVSLDGFPDSVELKREEQPK